jgi:pimeloyl-ACP methyl ester carboxylesterase
MTTTSERPVSTAHSRRPNPAGAPGLTRHRGGSGQPLVLVHGLGLSWRSWQPVLDALEDRHDVVAIDLPGFGESPRLPNRAAPTPARLADAVESELDRLGLNAPALVGNSLGGWIALELARRRRAARAVVISPSGLESPVERALVIAFNELMRLRARFGAPLGQWLTAPTLARVMLFAGLRSQPWRLSPDAAAGDLREFAYSTGFQATLSSTVATRAPMWLGEIEVPVRVAYGTLDLMLGVLTAPRFAAAIPRAELVPLPAVGHVPMLDDPELVARTILDFTADADTGPRRATTRRERGQSPYGRARPIPEHLEFPSILTRRVEARNVGNDAPILQTERIE